MLTKDTVRRHSKTETPLINKSQSDVASSICCHPINISIVTRLISFMGLVLQSGNSNSLLRADSVSCYSILKQTCLICVLYTMSFYFYSQTSTCFIISICKKESPTRIIYTPVKKCPLKMPLGQNNGISLYRPYRIQLLFGPYLMGFISYSRECGHTALSHLD